MVWSTAQLRLNNFLKEQREIRFRVDAPPFGQALEIYEKELEASHNIKYGSKGYRRRCILKLQRTTHRPCFGGWLLDS